MQNYANVSFAQSYFNYTKLRKSLRKHKFLNFDSLTADGRFKSGHYKNRVSLFSSRDQRCKQSSQSELNHLLTVSDVL